MSLPPRRTTVFAAAACAVPFALYALWLAFPITIITADIGRHITNGRMLLTQPAQWSDVLYTNFYSYTHGGNPIVNHHWLAGPVFFVLKQLGGWKGLHLVYMLSQLAALAFFFDVARRLAGWKTAAGTAAVLVPLIAQRVAVRPEGLAYLCAGLLFWLLHRIRNNELPVRWLWLAPVVTLLWVNVHASFPVALLLVGFFTIDAILRFWRGEAGQRELRTYGLVAAASVVATLINPSFLEGALYPLSILQDPGYAVIENQSVLFLEKWGMDNPNFLLLKLATALFLVLVFFAAAVKAVRSILPHIGIAAVAVILAWLGLRHLTLAGFFLLPVLAALLVVVWRRCNASWCAAAVAAGTLAVIAGLLWQGYRLSNRWIVLGLEPKANAAAEFIERNGIEGPVFNNFDIGGYLIYHLFPEEKVFVDNRPEAYPPSFFRNVYVPMQQQRAVWNEQLATHRFNSIVVYYRDRTSWAQQFVKARLTDPQWAPVFADKNVLVLLRYNERNRGLIDAYEIPGERFGISKQE